MALQVLWESRNAGLQMHKRQRITAAEFTKEIAFENRLEFSDSGIHIVWGGGKSLQVSTLNIL